MNDLASKLLRTALGILLIVLPLMAMTALIAVWPVASTGSAGDNAIDALPIINIACPFDVRLFIIVVLCGGLGSYIHAATSFATYVGNNSLHRSWLWWYLLRPFIGCALALVFYLVVRGGLLSVNGNGSGDLNPFGIAAVSAMVGMFSKQAADKLRETFDNLFRTAPGQGDDERQNKVLSQSPTISQLDPSTVPANSAALTIRVNGLNFVGTSVLLVNGSDRVTRYLSESTLEADLISPDVASAGVLQVSIRNPKGAGGMGAVQPFHVM